MMRSRGFNILILIGLALSSHAQFLLSGRVLDEQGKGIAEIEVHDKTEKLTTVSDQDGAWKMYVSNKGEHEMIFFGYEFNPMVRKVQVLSDTRMDVELNRLSTNLEEVTIEDAGKKTFNVRRLNMVEGTSIYAGKKSEVVLMDQMVGNKAANNARQIYSQVVGLNIYESGDAGLQLSIGGRGLDPNRTANFNTRQNGYDISADVLGYPESYYTPPAEALSQIQIVRGAASLQYGTQFGGLINFVMKKPSKEKVEFTTINSLGSFNLFSTFNSLSGTVKKFSYYTYFHRKSGDGFRSNSKFSSNNFYGNFNYQLSQATSLSLDVTHLNYLAQQAGGLTDDQFQSNPSFSNRSRNWFEVNWNLVSFKLEHDFSPESKISVSLFGLDASRHALGFRGNPYNLNSNPISDDDPMENGEFIYERDLIKGTFRNGGAEIKFLTRYTIKEQPSVLLLGAKYYHAENSSQQGAASHLSDANFTFTNNQDYLNQSSFDFPNRNLSFFGENIFFLNDKLSITPGFRYEIIRTASDGFYTDVKFDNAGNVISNVIEQDDRALNRSFALFGMGLSYRPFETTEVYGNISQNYRSITFSDIRTASPTFVIDPDIRDEEGFTGDIGVRGQIGKLASFDVGGFGLMYNDRIGIVLDNRANRVRKNIGQAFIYGLEMFGDLNLSQVFGIENGPDRINIFVNSAITGSEYISSLDNNIDGKKVEFIPTFNFKTGLNFGYDNFVASVQWSFISEQFSDAENSRIPESSDNRLGLIGEIPGYSVLDLSFGYTIGKFSFESGINNLLDENYFTRRATGYPGPGIIPSDPRNFYLTMQLQF